MTFQKPLIALAFIAVIGLWGCSNEQTKPLKLSDLKFPDVEKEAIKRNNIDTVFLISKNVLLNLRLFNIVGHDTIGFNNYDAFGNILTEQRKEFDGHFVQFEYDSLGFLKHKIFSTDVELQYKVDYQFNSNNRMFQQFWTYKYHTDTSFYKFDIHGKLISTDESNHATLGVHMRTKYDYNERNLLITKTDSFLFSRNDSAFYKLNQGEKANFPVKNITKYHYSGNKIDFTDCTFYFSSNSKKNYTEKTYYDELGLKNKTVLMDTLVTTYIYKRRK